MKFSENDLWGAFASRKLLLIFGGIMKTYHILYNNAAGGHEEGTRACIAEVEKLGGRIKMVNLENFEGHRALVEGLGENDVIVICGGDGTLNHYINGLRGVEYSQQVLYYPGGSGNDFFHCVNGSCDPKLIEVTHLVKGLPTALIKGKEYTFINGIGYGIDGYCCEVADKQREKGKTEINYTAIAILGVLFFYKPTGATVTVDGVEHRFENAWLCPMMNGRYFGGGMMPTPDQVRNSGELSVMIFSCPSKIRLLTIFPSLFKGEHVKHEKYVTILKGKEITVKYDQPRPLQVDGETIVDVPECTVRAYSKEDTEA